MTQRIGIAVLGLGWMGQAHSRSALPHPVAVPRSLLPARARRVRRHRAAAPRPGGRGLRLRSAQWRTGRRRSTAPDVDAVWVTAPEHAARADDRGGVRGRQGGVQREADRRQAGADRRRVSRRAGGRRRHRRRLQLPVVAAGAARARADRVRRTRGDHPLPRPVPVDVRQRRARPAHLAVHARPGRLRRHRATSSATRCRWRSSSSGGIAEVVGMRHTTIPQRPLPDRGRQPLRPRGARDPKGDGGERGLRRRCCAASSTGRRAPSRPAARPSARRARTPSRSTAPRGRSRGTSSGSTSCSTTAGPTDPSSGYTTIFGGDRFPFHGAFVPGQANAIGFEDLVAIEDYSFLEALATGTRFSPGLPRGRRRRQRPAGAHRLLGRPARGSPSVTSQKEASSMTSTVRITTAEAIVRYLVAQRIVVDGEEVPLFPGVFAIFGHGNVTSLGHALESTGTRSPSWRGQNEQGMGLAAVAFAKAMRRRQVMVCTSSIGPGATNMVTAAGVAMANRLPVLFISGDTFSVAAARPGAAAGGALRRPDDDGQRRLPAGRALLGPDHPPGAGALARCRRPSAPCSTRPTAGRPSSGCRRTSRPRRSTSRRRSSTPSGARDRPAAARPRPGRARRPTRSAQRERPLIIAGGGVHYSRAEAELAAFAEQSRHPRRRDGRRQVLAARRPSALRRPDRRHRRRCGQRVVPPRPTWSSPSAPGSRTSPPGSWTVFDADARASSASTPPASTPSSTSPLRSSATPGRPRRARRGARRRLDGAGRWTDAGRRDARRLAVPSSTAGTADDGVRPPSYAQVVGAVHASATRRRLRRSPPPAGFPGELNINWLSKAIATLRLRVRLLVHGLRDLPAPGARPFGRARPARSIVVRRRRLVPDAELARSTRRCSRARSSSSSSATTGASPSSSACRSTRAARPTTTCSPTRRARVRRAGRLRRARRVAGRAQRARPAASPSSRPRSSGPGRPTAPRHRHRRSAATTGPRAAPFWQVGVPEVSDLASVRDARAAHEAGMATQRRGV